MTNARHHNQPCLTAAHIRKRKTENGAADNETGINLTRLEDTHLIIWRIALSFFLYSYYNESYSLRNKIMWKKWFIFHLISSMKDRWRKRWGNVHGKLNASWKICSLAVNGQPFLVIDGYLLNPLFLVGNDNRLKNCLTVIDCSSIKDLRWKTSSINSSRSVPPFDQGTGSCKKRTNNVSLSSYRFIHKKFIGCKWNRRS